jgi:hypothetical protein
MFFKPKFKQILTSSLHHWKLIFLCLILIATFIPLVYHFKNNKNQENKISYNISQAYTGDYQYQNKNQDFQVSFINRKEPEKPWVNFTVGKENMVMALENQNENIKNPMPTLPTGQAGGRQENDNVKIKNDDTQKNQLVINDILPDTDLTYQIIEKGLKEDIVLKNKEALGNNKKPEYQFTLKSDNVEPIEISKGIYSPAFQNKVTKEYAFHFLRPIMIDAKGAKSDEIMMQIKKQEDGKYTIILKPSSEWLNDKERVFPIRIDPSIVHDESSEFAGTKNRIEDIGSGSAPKLQIQNSIGGNDQYTKLLLHADGADNSTTFSDSQMIYANRKTVTASGNAKISTTQSEFGGSSAYFDGTGDYLSVPDSEDWNFGSGDFTIDFWMRTPSISGWQGILSQFNSTVANRSVQLYNYVDNYLWFDVTDASNAYSVKIPDSEISANTWYHIALIRNGSYTHAYVNGVEKGTAANVGSATLNNSSLTFDVGRTIDTSNNSHYFNGYLDELRISKDIARWTSNFTPPTRAYDFKKDYAVYDSPIVDAGQSAQWSTITWTENGVATGDGETPYDSTSLVAGWNFNETSGTSATSGGTCGTSCNGTLTNFASTASQDQAPGTGWTANNRRWGAGALSFDGTNDYVSVPDSDNWNFGTGDFSIETWVNFATLPAQQPIIGQRYDGDNQWWLHRTSSNTLRYYNQISGVLNIDLSSAVLTWETGKWYSVVLTRNGNNFNIYLDGRSVASTTDSDSASNFSIPLKIGEFGASYFKGTIDSTRIYKGRALSANEILSNYNAGNIELQTRSGATSDPNDGTWEAWKPSGAGTETAVDAMDANNTSGDAYTKLLLHGEGNNNSTGFRDDSLFRKTLTANGDAKISTTQTKLGSSSMYFDGTGDYLSVPNSTDFNFGTGDFTIDTWVRFSSVVSNGVFINNQEPLAGVNGWVFRLNGINGLMFQYGTGSIQTISVTGFSPSVNTWYQVAVAKTGSTLRFFVDGTQVGADQTLSGAIADSTQVLKVGANAGSSYDFNGYLDELRISKGIARWTSNFTPPTAPYDNPNQLVSSNSTSIKTEGTSSMKIEQGKSQCDGNTVALWHLDETGGTGAYLKDSCGTNHGTPTGTTVTDGINNKGRSFNGTTGDYVNIGNNTALQLQTFSLEVWVKRSQVGVGDIIYGYGASGWIWNITSANTISLSKTQVGQCLSTGTIGDLNWHHIAVTYDGATCRFYVDGQLDSSPAYATTFSFTSNFAIGIRQDNSTNPFHGTIDEARVSNVIRTPEEIAESYRLGRDQRISRTFSSTDLSAKNKLPFYVAADRRGTYLDATIGESAFANYEPDESTVGLWHLDEQSGSGAYLKDSSSYANNGTPTGTSFVEGKIGKGRSFNGTSDKITSIPINLLSYNTFTTSAWVKVKASTGTAQTFIGGENVVAGGLNAYLLSMNSSQQILFWLEGASGVSIGPSSDTYISLNEWHHLAAVKNQNTDAKLYIDGRLVGTDSSVSSTVAWTGLSIGSLYSGSPVFFVNGLIDEVRFDSISRTPQEIRQAYEVGKRTHQITIDFSASLDSGNLITNSSDLSFTINSQTYGSPNKGDNLYAGDKIIVRENYDGTEYLAQGTVTNVDQSTGAVTISSWDSGGTFPTSGFTQNAIAFKWQREYMDITGSLADQRNAINRITMRTTDGSEARTIYLDDFESSTNYLTNSNTTNNITSTNNRYFQYRAITSTTDYNFTPYLSQTSLTYVTPPVVTTQIPSSITKTTATANGNITDTGNGTVTRRGFEYGLTQANTWETHEDGSFTTTGTFSLPITEGLVKNTDYYIRSYATNSISTSYGAWTAFHTNLEVSPIELKKNVELKRNVEMK